MSQIATMLQQAAQALARGDRAEVQRLCKMVLRQRPGLGPAQRLLARLAYDRGDFAEAGRLARLALAGGDPGAHEVLAATFLKLGQPQQAVSHSRAALTVAKGSPRSAYNLAMALLAAGDWSEGWERFEARWQIRPPSWVQPWDRMWDGGDPAGRRLLVHAEQGLGDTLQFVRYLPKLAERGARIILAVQPPLVRLLAGLPGVESVLTAGDRVPPWDLHVPLMSLPRLFATTPRTVPSACPYLPAQPPMPLPDGAPRIGVVWSGNAADPEDHLRSLPPAALAALLEGLPDAATVVSLQPDQEDVLDTLPAGRRVLRLGRRLHDFTDTAAAVAALDLVISVDTAVAHLAGGLGRPVRLLLMRGPDWRWRASGEATPWYPTMRLFRQESAGDWGRVVAAAAALPI